MIELPTDRIIKLLNNQDAETAKNRALAHDYTTEDVVESAFRIGDVMLQLAESYDQVHVEYPTTDGTAFDLWLESTRAKNPYMAHILTNWITVSRTDFALYPIFLYNKNFGRTQDIFTKFLTRDKPPPPYLFLLLFNAMRHAMGLSHTEIATLYTGPFQGMADVFHELFSSTALDRWFERCALSLRYYGGATNTVLGLYDENFNDPQSGAARFNREADLVYDLGGGYNSPETERLLGRKVISADIISPRYADYDEDIVFLEVGPNSSRRVVHGDARERFLQAQRAIEYFPFNVHEDSFPAHASSYGIVSTGFMTSTVRPQKHQADWMKNTGNGFGHVALSIQAMMRVIELAQKGKDVDLFTVQRASSRVYRYKTCLLQWRQGKLVNLTTTDDKQNHNRYSETAMIKIQARVHPENDDFNRYLSGG